MIAKTLYWKNGKTYILNQKLLPWKVKYVCCKNYIQVAKTIRDMIIRGAPAIGVAAGFGIALASISDNPIPVNFSINSKDYELPSSGEIYIIIDY